MHSRHAGEMDVARTKLATNPSALRKGHPPSRIGKKGVTFYLEPDAIRQLRMISIDEDTTLQALMVEAANLLFRSRGQTENAK